MSEIKRMKWGVAYAVTPDGTGNLMASHYPCDIDCVKNESMGFSKTGNWTSLPVVPSELHDDYSTGIKPGFSLPKEKINNKVHQKTTITNPTMSIGSWHVNDYYTLGKFPRYYEPSSKSK